MGGGFLSGILFPSRHARPRSGIQGNKSLFMRCVNVPIKAESVLLDPRLRKEDGWRGVMGGGFFHRRGHLPFLKNIKKPPQVYPATIFKR